MNALFFWLVAIDLCGLESPQSCSSRCLPHAAGHKVEVECAVRLLLECKQTSFYPSFTFAEETLHVFFFLLFFSGMTYINLLSCYFMMHVHFT